VTLLKKYDKNHIKDKNIFFTFVLSKSDKCFQIQPNTE
jgi:hypothetical protein